MAALTRDILGFKYYRADTEGGNRQKCEQMIQVSVDIMLSGYYLFSVCVLIFGHVHQNIWQISMWQRSEQ